jgi:hypothetical protein
MPVAAHAPAEVNGQVLAAAGVVLAAGLGLAAFQWWVRRGRPPAASDDEARHDLGTDLRRFGVSALLGLIGAVMVASTRIDLKVPPPANRDAARLWTWSWLAVLAMLLAVVVLALADWLAARAFAVREAGRLVRDHRALLAEALGRPKPMAEPDDEL